MGEESNKKRKASLVFDWDKLLDSHPPEIVATKISSDMTQSAMGNGDSNRHNYESLSDVALDKLIARKKGTYSMAPKLPDKGKKLSEAITMLEQEKERRYNNTPKLKDDNGSEMPTHFESSSVMKSNKKRKASLVFVWDKLLDSHDDSDPPEIVVTKISSDMTQSAMGYGDSNRHNYESLSDVALDELIARKKGIYQSMAPKLPDKGKLLSDAITMLEQEKERRYKNTPKLKDDNGSEMPTHFESSSVMKYVWNEGRALKTLNIEDKDKEQRRDPDTAKEKDRFREKYWKNSIQEVDPSNCQRCSSSYRPRPEDYPIPSASQRSELGAQVLNDYWVSVTSGGEDYSFKHMRRNQYEESLFRCEDDRFELDMLLESVSSTAKRAEELIKNINDKTINFNSQFRLDDHFTALNLRCIERLYGDHGLDTIDILRKNPSHSMHVILTRLRQKQEEWSKCRLDFNKVWADIYSKNHYKLLDHRSFYLKQQDSKNLSTKCTREDCYNLIKYACDEIYASKEQSMKGMRLCCTHLEPMLGVPSWPLGSKDSELPTVSRHCDIKSSGTNDRGIDENLAASAAAINSKQLKPSSNGDYDNSTKQVYSVRTSLLHGFILAKEDGVEHSKDPNHTAVTDKVSESNEPMVFAEHPACSNVELAVREDNIPSHVDMEIISGRDATQCPTNHAAEISNGDACRSGDVPLMECYDVLRSVLKVNGALTEGVNVDKNNEESVDPSEIEKVEGELSLHSDFEEDKLDSYGVSNPLHIATKNTNSTHCQVGTGEDISCQDAGGENDVNGDDEDTEHIFEAGEDVSGSESTGEESDSDTDDEDSENVSEDGEDVSGSEFAKGESDATDVEDCRNVSEDGEDDSGSESAADECSQEENEEDEDRDDDEDGKAESECEAGDNAPKQVYSGGGRISLLHGVILAKEDGREHSKDPSHTAITDKASESKGPMVSSEHPAYSNAALAIGEDNISSHVDMEIISGLNVHQSPTCITYYAAEISNGVACRSGDVPSMECFDFLTSLLKVNGALTEDINVDKNNEESIDPSKIEKVGGELSPHGDFKEDYIDACGGSNPLHIAEKNTKTTHCRVGTDEDICCHDARGENDANGDDEDNENVTEAGEDVSGSESGGKNDSDTDDEDSDEDISEAGEDVSGSESAGRENVSVADDEDSESVSDDGEDVSGRESAGRENNDADTHNEDSENVSEAGEDILGSKYAGESVVTVSKKRKGGPGGYGREQVKKFVYRKSGEAGSGDEDIGDELVSSLKSAFDAHKKLVNTGIAACRKLEKVKKKLAEKEAMYRTLNGKNEEVNNKLRQANEALPTLQEALNKEKQRANQLTSEVESWKKKFEEAEQSRQSERIRAEGAEKKLNEAPKNEQIIEEFKKSEEFKDAVVVECAGVFKTIVERRWLFYKDDLNRPFSEWVDFEAKLKADADGSGLRK